MVAEKRQDAPAPPEVRMVPLDTIRLDGETQCREEVDGDTVRDYAARIDAGDRFPPPRVVTDGRGNLWLWDGFHRLAALALLGREGVEVEATPGTLDDARRLAVGANGEPRALRRSNKDKRRAVTLALGWWPDLSSRAIADLAGVSDDFVGTVRRQVQSDCTSTARTGMDGKTYPAARSGPEPDDDDPGTPPFDGPLGESAAFAPGRHTPPAPKPGTEKWGRKDWGEYEAALASLGGLIGRVCAAYGQPNSRKAEDVRDALSAADREFRALADGLERVAALRGA